MFTLFRGYGSTLVSGRSRRPRGQGRIRYGILNEKDGAFHRKTRRAKRCTYASNVGIGFALSAALGSNPKLGKECLGTGPATFGVETITGAKLAPKQKETRQNKKKTSKYVSACPDRHQKRQNTGTCEARTHDLWIAFFRPGRSYQRYETNALANCAKIPNVLLTCY